VRYDDQIDVYHVQTIDLQRAAAAAAATALFAK
jgi:hypothetical protein